jgi:hypothetical protein
LDAYYRIQPERRFRPNASHLASADHPAFFSFATPGRIAQAHDLKSVAARPFIRL